MDSAVERDPYRSAGQRAAQWPGHRRPAGAGSARPAERTACSVPPRDRLLAPRRPEPRRYAAARLRSAKSTPLGFGREAREDARRHPWRRRDRRRRASGSRTGHRGAGCRGSSSARRGTAATSASCSRSGRSRSATGRLLLGVAWALLQPLAGLVIFTIVFGRLAKLPSDGLPYAVFVYPAMCLWSYVSTSVIGGGGGAAAEPAPRHRVYFPRILSPAAAVAAGAARLRDRAGAHRGPAGGLRRRARAADPARPDVDGRDGDAWRLASARWLAAINVKYRDVRHVLPFLLQTWFFREPDGVPVLAGERRLAHRVRAQPACRAWSTDCAGRWWAEAPPPIADLASLASAHRDRGRAGCTTSAQSKSRFADVI